MLIQASHTKHFQRRAHERQLSKSVEEFLLRWGTETWAAGASQITLVRNELPADVRDSKEALRAEGWILVLAADGALLTCYRRRAAWRFIRTKRECPYRRRRTRRC